MLKIELLKPIDDAIRIMTKISNPDEDITNKQQELFFLDFISRLPNTVYRSGRCINPLDFTETRGYFISKTKFDGLMKEAYSEDVNAPTEYEPMEIDRENNGVTVNVETDSFIVNYHDLSKSNTAEYKKLVDKLLVERSGCEMTPTDEPCKFKYTLKK